MKEKIVKVSFGTRGEWDVDVVEIETSLMEYAKKHAKMFKDAWLEEDENSEYVEEFGIGEVDFSEKYKAFYTCESEEDGSLFLPYEGDAALRVLEIEIENDDFDWMSFEKLSEK